MHALLRLLDTSGAGEWAHLHVTLLDMAPSSSSWPDLHTRVAIAFRRRYWSHTHFGVLLWCGVMMLDDADIAVTARQDRAPGQGEFPSVLLDYDDVTADDEDVDCGGFSEHDSFQHGRWK